MEMVGEMNENFNGRNEGKRAGTRNWKSSDLYSAANRRKAGRSGSPTIFI